MPKLTLVRREVMLPGNLLPKDVGDCPGKHHVGFILKTYSWRKPWKNRQPPIRPAALFSFSNICLFPTYTGHSCQSA